MRDGARAPEPPTNQQKAHLCTLFALVYGPAWDEMTKNASFGPNLAVFGQNILIFTGVSKSFGTNIMEGPPTTFSDHTGPQHWTFTF